MINFYVILICWRCTSTQLATTYNTLNTLYLQQIVFDFKDVLLEDVTKYVCVLNKLISDVEKKIFITV